MSNSESQIIIGLNAVILAVTEEEPRILTVRPPEYSVAAGEEELGALPFGPLDLARDRTLELGLRRWVRERTGIELGYVEQLYTFGDRNRDPRERLGGPRVLSIGYLTLVQEGKTASGGRTRWQAWYEYFPWEDWRDGRPAILTEKLEPALARWVDQAADPRVGRSRQERVDIAFGLGGAPWDGYRVLDRYELLYEAGLVGEALRDRRLFASAEPATAAADAAASAETPRLGRPMCFDHRRILATALSRLRGKIKYRPVVFELLPSTFTLLQLQRVVEALAGWRLHKQNFRRLVDKGGLVEGTGRLTSGTGGRPAELFRFRREVLRERPASGVGLPSLPVD
ncbi:MAG: hypothetical protein GY856_54090 [bacterium]|nr:hypothetical protein [bacterium]